MENQIPYELHAFKIFLREKDRAFQEYYESYGFGLIRLFLETMGRVKELQRTHTQLPKHPFYTHSVHQLANILVLNTIRSKYTLLVVALNKSLSTIQNLQV